MIAASVIREKVMHLSQYQKAKTVGAYIAYQDEVSTRELIDHTIAANKILCLPRIMSFTEHTMAFYLFDGAENLEKNRYGITEPKESCKTIALSDIDFMIVPMVGFDERCYRIGTGGGFYDVLLNSSDKRPFLCGIAFDVQRCEDISPEAWDVPMDLIITESHIYKP